MEEIQWFRPSRETPVHIRILAQLGENIGHWITAPAGGIQKIPCAGDQCELCHHPITRKTDRSLLTAVLDRRDDTVKLFDMRGSILRGIKDALLRPTRIRNLDLSRFDVIITTDGQPPFVNYNVCLDRPKRLTRAEETKAREFLANMVIRHRPNCRV